MESICLQENFDGIIGSDKLIRMNRKHPPATWYRCDFGLTEVAVRRLFEGDAHSGRAFRQLLARLSDENNLGLPPSVFHYNEAGSPLQGPPLLRFIGYAKGVALVGLSQAGVALAREVVPIVHAALTRHAGALIRVNERSGAVTFQPTPMPLRYFAASAALSPTPSLKRWLAWLQESQAQGVAFSAIPAAREAMTRVIEAALVRQMDWLDPVGVALEERTPALEVAHAEVAQADGGPEGQGQGQGGGVTRPARQRSHWSLLESEDDELTMARRGPRPFEVTIHSCGKHFFETRMNASSLALQRATGIGPKSALPILGFKQLEFSVNASLQGIWQIGRRTSSGYGLVIPARARAELPEAT